jgi:hypothetical protein
MVDERDGQGATDRAAPFLFDTRLLSEIQAEGLRAAGALVDRLVQLVDGPHSGAEADGDPTPQSGPASVDMGAVLPWFDLWRDLADRTSDSLQRLRAADAGSEEVRIGVDGGLAPSRALAIITAPDGHGHGEMWLHNGTATDQGPLLPQFGPLHDPHGAALVCDIQIDPPMVDALPSRSSRGFAIAVTVDPSIPAGTYRGIVQVKGAEQVWMPVEIVVPAPSS